MHLSNMVTVNMCLIAADGSSTLMYFESMAQILLTSDRKHFLLCMCNSVKKNRQTDRTKLLWRTIHLDWSFCVSFSFFVFLLT